ncbi:MAG: GNAT family N-acetyltransferase [Pseudomonadota bacterium]
MKTNVEIEIRQAEVSDALALAKLIDIAGEGIPNWLWSKSVTDEKKPLDIGVERASREQGGFSYTNALVAEVMGEIKGMILSYPIDSAPQDNPEDLPAPIAPFVELEKHSVDTWYINALAVFAGNRGAGIGSKLMAKAEELARLDGHKSMSIQVYSQNTEAVRLYKHLGYDETVRAKVLDHPCQPYYDEDVLLLIKQLA